MRVTLTAAGATFMLWVTLTAAQDTLPVQPQYIDAIDAITADDRVQAAMEHIVAIEPRSLDDLIELTEIPAPPFGEQARAARFAEMLREAGLEDVQIDDVGNVVGRRPGTTGDRVVGYSAHLDTVFPAETDVTVRFEDGKMYAPGIGDNTRGLVTVLGVLRAMQHAGIRGRLLGQSGLRDFDTGDCLRSPSHPLRRLKHRHRWRIGHPLQTSNHV